VGLAIALLLQLRLDAAAEIIIDDRPVLADIDVALSL